MNGTSANLGPISLRNIHLRATQSTDYVKPGSEAELLFVADVEGVMCDGGVRFLNANISAPALVALMSRDESDGPLGDF